MRSIFRKRIVAIHERARQGLGSIWPSQVSLVTRLVRTKKIGEGVLEKSSSSQMSLWNAERKGCAIVTAVLMVATAMVGCGGSGGPSAVSGASGDIAKEFEVGEFSRRAFQGNISYSMSGTASNGVGYRYISTRTAAAEVTWQGRQVLRKAHSSTYYVGSNAPQTSITNHLYELNGSYIGFEDDGGNVWFKESSGNRPWTVRVGDKGYGSSGSLYTDAARTSRLSSRKGTWRVFARDDQNAWYCSALMYLDLSGRETSRTEHCYELERDGSPAGGVSFERQAGSFRLYVSGNDYSIR